ncbi:MAG: phenylphosphate carboxylase subunit gamma, partial [Thermodesulfobacteriota bacterium]|nr:phenylphosphate carboxylase subunit gamma [Thermodesulfobacteriota bacterium]
MKEYDTFVNFLTDLKENEEIELSIRDCDTYDARVVKAIISSKPETLPGNDSLLIRFSRGQLATKEPWAIKII